jgi:hypothetical protein
MVQMETIIECYQVVNKHLLAPFNTDRDNSMRTSSSGSGNSTTSSSIESDTQVRAAVIPTRSTTNPFIKFNGRLPINCGRGRHQNGWTYQMSCHCCQSSLKICCDQFSGCDRESGCGRKMVYFYSSSLIASPVLILHYNNRLIVFVSHGMG